LGVPSLVRPLAARPFARIGPARIVKRRTLFVLDTNLLSNLRRANSLIALGAIKIYTLGTSAASLLGRMVETPAAAPRAFRCDRRLFQTARPLQSVYRHLGSSARRRVA
jgi:hypothetical protein